MENVSVEWKALHEQDLLPENFVKITYRVTEPGLNDTYSTATNGEAVYSDTSDLSNTEGMIKYATLEPGIWMLDGSCYLLPDEAPYGDNKFVSSEFCDNDGYFTVNPVITFLWESVHASIIPGITVQWSALFDEYPIEFIVRVKNGDTVINTFENTLNDSALNVIMTDIQNFNKVEVEIKRWNIPNHRARMEQLFVGIINTYTKDNIMSFSATDSVDVLSGELPEQSVTFVLDNTENQWNPINPQGLTKYLSEQQSVEIRYGMSIDGNVEWIDGGLLYLAEWSTPTNGIEASFTAKNILSFMDVPYTGTRTGTLYDIAVAAIGQIDLPDYATYQFDVTLATVSIDFSADTNDYSVAEILQMVANAGQCIIYQDRKGCLRIEPMQSELSDYTIGKQWLYSWLEVSLSKKLRNVIVNNGLAVVNNDVDGAEQTVDNPLITTEELARVVGEWTMSMLKGRTTVSGEFRPDVRLSAGDIITTENQFSESGNKIVVTSIKYDFDGGFKGTIEGRVIE